MDKKKRPIDYKKYKSVEQKGNKKKKMSNAKKCPYCGYDMRHRGCGDAAGGYSWKCRNKKCGRTVWKRREVVPPEPVIPASLIS
jgi:hypothetical protein